MTSFPKAKWLLLLLAFLVTERFCHWQTSGFRVHKVASTLSPRADWEIAPLSSEQRSEIGQILSQPFHFLGNGGQCYAFISEDGQSVLKLFKQHHMRPESWFNKIWLPSFFENQRQRILKNRRHRLELIFGSCKIAYDQFREGTGLLYIHLNKTDEWHRPLTLVDKIGIAHQIDLDQTEFALQKCATLALPTLDDLIAKGNVEEAKQAIDSLLQLIIDRSKAGIGDQDPVIRRNFGFLGTRAVEIDLGSYFKDPYLQAPSQYRRVLFLETLNFKTWLQKNHPELCKHLDTKLNELLENG